MGKKKGIVASELTDVMEDILFSPNPVQRKAKARFWSRYEPNPIGDGNVSLEMVQRVTGDPSTKRWWGLPGFKEWFLNAEESRERLEYLFNVALDTAESILVDPDANDNAKVQMIKVIAQLAGKEPTRREEKFLDAEIQKMSESQLRAYLEKKGALKIVGGSTGDSKERENAAGSSEESKSHRPAESG